MPLIFSSPGNYTSERETAKVLAFLEEVRPELPWGGGVSFPPTRCFCPFFARWPFFPVSRDSFKPVECILHSAIVLAMPGTNAIHSSLIASGVTGNHEIASFSHELFAQNDGGDW